MVVEAIDVIAVGLELVNAEVVIVVIVAVVIDGDKLVDGILEVIVAADGIVV